MFLVALLFACGEDKSSTTAGCASDATYGESVLCTSWLINNADTNSYIGSSVGVQSAEVDGDFMVIETSGIPDYNTTLSSAMVDALSNRPKAADDFASGAPTVATGDVVVFGQDIGYSNPNCDLGYWPPGPTCASDQASSVSIPLVPTPANNTDCDTGAGSLGRWVTGVAIYGWSDTQSYDTAGNWSNVAVKLEAYDLDICGGHAGFGGEYHHHGASECLRQAVGDDGGAHSGVWGIAGDGYPVYGPWFADGVLAEPCWKARDYASSETGCADGKRSCHLVDAYDPSQGTVATSTSGPDLDASILSMSQNEFLAESGLFFQDYYFDQACAEQGAQYLDEHNGHDHDDLGYHYHVTVEFNSAGLMVDKFPMHIGPTFAGELPSGSSSTCDTGTSGGPPNGGPPPQ